MREAAGKVAQLVRDPGVQVDITSFLFALLLSFFVAIAVAALYQLFYQNRATGSQVHRSFLLLGPSITAIFIAIQFSLPLSLGLLGALSIIRFRTPIKEAEEVGFIMLLIASSIICATFQFTLLLVLIALATMVLIGQRVVPRFFKKNDRRDGMLLLTLNGDSSGQHREKVLQLLYAKLPNSSLESICYAEDTATIHVSFNDLNSNGLNGLHESLNQIAPFHKLNVYFNRQSTLPL